MVPDALLSRLYSPAFCSSHKGSVRLCRPGCGQNYGYAMHGNKEMCL
uniref:Uncharacterized protein n=1 Tax=Anguilla anguilla TaxID=7936 RepID=A0A0E9WA22_ANGAN